ncbi:MAG TPA: hypothetical protein VGC84_01405 [Ilumatobacteraceae bacterium]
MVRKRVAVARLLTAALLLLAGCSGSGASDSTQSSTSTSVAAPKALPRVDLIKTAVSALETKLGAPQRFFEINATASLVNLIVSLNDDKVAQPWVYLDGTLSSTDAGDANGFSFASSALTFDPDKVLSKLQAELPNSSPDLFFIEGGQGGIVRYSVAITSSQGGQLVVVVGPDGTIQSVDPG